MKRRRDWKTPFLEAMRLMGNVMRSCSFAKVNRANVYDEYDRNPEFARAWDEAEEEAADRLEAEAWRRAHDGIDKPVFHQGEQCGVIREYSDGLMTLLLKACRPGKYRENSNVTIGNPDGTKLEMDCRQQAVNLFTNCPEAAAHMIALANLACPENPMINDPVRRPEPDVSVPIEPTAMDAPKAAVQPDTGAQDCQGSPIAQDTRQKRKYTRKAPKQPKSKKNAAKASQTAANDVPEDLEIPAPVGGYVENGVPMEHVKGDEFKPIGTVPPAKIVEGEATPSPHEPPTVEPQAEELSPLMKQMLGK